MKITRKLIDKLSLLLGQIEPLVFHPVTDLGALDLGKERSDNDRQQQHHHQKFDQ
jgi:hypothetical protein